MITLDCERVACCTERVRSEYADLPGLSLTGAQMARLFGFDIQVLDAVLERLLSTHILRRTADGSYVAFSSAH